MAARPRIVAFDVIETTFSLESLRPRLSAQGIPGASLETWFARILRDAFALAATDTYAGFRDIAAATLAEVAASTGGNWARPDSTRCWTGSGNSTPIPTPPRHSAL